MEPRLELMLAYAATSLSAAALTSIYTTYYVEIFLQVYHLDANMFLFGQLLYAIWNAINDPLFGYVCDLLVKRGVARSTQMLYASPVFVVSFLLPLLPVSQSHSSLQGLHFIASLFFWDSGLTFVLLNHCALLPELCTSGKERGRMSTLVSLGSLIGSSVALFPTFSLFSRSSMSAFTYYCVLVAVVSQLVFVLSARGIRRHETVVSEERVSRTLVRLEEFDSSGGSDNDLLVQNTNNDEEDNKVEVTHSPSPVMSEFKEESYIHQVKGGEEEEAIYSKNKVPQHEMIPYFSFLKQILQSSNFVIFVIVNFLNIFVSVLFDSFRVSYIKYAVQPFLTTSPTDGNSPLVSIYFSLCSLVPNLCALVTSSLSIRFSTYMLLKVIFVVRIVASCIALLMCIGNRGDIGLPATLFLFVAVSALGAVGRLLEMSLADCVDEDAVSHTRRHTMSSSIFGSNALLTKPAHSLAPSIGALILRPYGYGTENQQNIDGSADITSIHPDIRYALFYMLMYMNLIGAFIQIVVWLFYTLHGKYLRETRKKVLDLRDHQR